MLKLFQCILRVQHSTANAYMQARSQPSENRGSFSSDFGPFWGLKIGVPNGYIGKNSIFKIIVIDDVTLRSKLESTW